MKKDNGFRYTLQFPAKTEEQRQVGALLEGLGSKKSALIVRAVAEYAARHPADETAIVVPVAAASPPGVTQEDVRRIVREMMQAAGESIQQDEAPFPQVTEPEDADITAMLAGLSLFSQK
jgi:pyruvate/2-oxoglutarate dehydrogenase complex dihydrolipoamide acyltransferase (E2) component